MWSPKSLQTGPSINKYINFKNRYKIKKRIANNISKKPIKSNKSIKVSKKDYQQSKKNLRGWTNTWHSWKQLRIKSPRKMTPKNQLINWIIHSNKNKRNSKNSVNALMIINVISNVKMGVLISIAHFLQAIKDPTYAPNLAINAKQIARSHNVIESVANSMIIRNRKIITAMRFMLVVKIANIVVVHAWFRRILIIKPTIVKLKNVLKNVFCVTNNALQKSTNMMIKQKR